MEDLSGKQFGQYRITAPFGEGGMAVVYKGYQESLNRYVAIKVLRGELAEEDVFVARFRREALAVARLSHTNILPSTMLGWPTASTTSSWTMWMEGHSKT